MSGRQGEPTLEAALAEAIRDMRARELDYRNPHGRSAGRMSKAVRQSLAATLADYGRLLTEHAATLPRKDHP